MAATKLDRYIVAVGPAGRVWWEPGETIPENYFYVRDAMSDEIALARQIKASQNPPVRLGTKMRALIARDAPPIPIIEECNREHEISQATAQKLRQMLADVQQKCLDCSIAGTQPVEELIEFISSRGFRLIDDLEGVIR
jgi:hypothetical protein